MRTAREGTAAPFLNRTPNGKGSLVASVPVALGRVPVAPDRF